MKYVYCLVLITSVTGCSHEANLKKGQWAYFEKWDRDADVILTLDEFMSGYKSSGFFSRWDRKENSITQAALCDSVFRALDRTKDSRLDSVELHTNEAFFFVGDSIQSIIDPAEFQLTKAQFTNQVCDTQIANTFDKQRDQQISSEEMANAMFEICDTNDDGNVSSLEFYLWQVYRN
jgi:hypothetical protein